MWGEGGLTLRVTEFCASLRLPLKWPVQQVQRLILAWPHYLCCPPPSSCPLCTHDPDLLTVLRYIKPAPARGPSHTLTAPSAWDSLPSNSHMCHSPGSCSQPRSALLLLNFQNCCETAINGQLNPLDFKTRVINTQDALIILLCFADTCALEATWVCCILVLEPGHNAVVLHTPRAVTSCW